MQRSAVPLFIPVLCSLLTSNCVLESEESELSFEIDRSGFTTLVMQSGWQSNNATFTLDGECADEYFLLGYPLELPGQPRYGNIVSLTEDQGDMPALCPPNSEFQDCEIAPSIGLLLASEVSSPGDSIVFTHSIGGGAVDEEDLGDIEYFYTIIASGQRCTEEATLVVSSHNFNAGAEPAELRVLWGGGTP